MRRNYRPAGRRPRTSRQGPGRALSAAIFQGPGDRRATGLVCRLRSRTWRTPWRSGVPVGHPTPPVAIAGLKSGVCDIAIMGIDPARATEVDYSPPFAQLDFTYLVPAGSSIQTLADADRPGVRIAVVRNHVSTLTLTRILRQATPVHSDVGCRFRSTAQRARGCVRLCPRRTHEIRA